MPIGDPCQPSPCGPNSQCLNVNGKASCSCLSNYQGTPPDCRPECIVSTECSMNRACVNQKCVDPCPGVCGINAKCDALSHSPFCSCGPGQNGDPFVKCFDMPRKSQKKFIVKTLRPAYGNCYSIFFSNAYTTTTSKSLCPIALWAILRVSRQRRLSVLHVYVQLHWITTLLSR